MLLVSRLIGDHHTPDRSVCLSDDRSNGLLVVFHGSRLNNIVLHPLQEMNTYSDNIGKNDARSGLQQQHSI